jgi:hypothetical protein
MIVERECTSCKCQNKIRLNPSNVGPKALGYLCNKCNFKNTFENPFYAEVQDENYTCVTNMSIIKDLCMSFEIYDANGKFLDKKEISNGINLVGRAAQSSIKNSFIKLNDPSVSKSHCSIILETIQGKTRFVLQDLGSANGSYVNGKKISTGTQVLLQLNDIITVGNTHMKTVVKF